MRYTLLFTFALISLFGYSQQNEVEYNKYVSNTLGQSFNYGVYSVYNTTDDTSKVPLVILLHGLGGNYKSFFHKGLKHSVDSFVDIENLTNFILVTPDGKKSYFMNNFDSSYQWETFLFNEFIPKLIGELPIDTNKIIISGFSMGGFGAINLAFKYPQKFSACLAISPAIRNDRMLINLSTNAYNKRYASVLGQDVEGTNRITQHWQENNIFYQVDRSSSSKLKNTYLYISCGDDDFLNPGNALTHLLLLDYGVYHDFRIYNGSHRWEYFLPSYLEALKLYFQQ